MNGLNNTLSLKLINKTQCMKCIPKKSDVYASYVEKHIFRLEINILFSVKYRHTRILRNPKQWLTYRPVFCGIVSSKEGLSRTSLQHGKHPEEK